MVGLEQRVVELERRIQALERRAGAFAGAPAAARLQPENIETAIGLGWLNRVGAALLIAGIALGAAWANEHGYLSPLLRNTLLAVASCAVFAVGALLLRARDSRRRSFAVGIAAVGAFGMYLAPFTASHIDEVIGTDAAAVLSVAITLTLAGLSRAHKIPALMTFALLGGLSIEFVAGGAAWTYGGLGLVATLYVLASRERPLILADHAAGITAFARCAVVAYGATESPWLPAAVAAAAYAASLGVRGLSDHRVDAVPLFTLAVVLTGVAWLLAAEQWGSTGTASHFGSTGALAAYALALVAIGVRWANPICRFIGLLALGASVVKLVVHDLWLLPSGLRVGGLFAIGVGLLLASFLYSRFAAADR